MSEAARLPLVEDWELVGQSRWDPKRAVLERALWNKVLRDRAARMGFEPPAGIAGSLLAAAKPDAYIASTERIEGGNPEAPTPAAAMFGLEMSGGGLPEGISRAGGPMVKPNPNRARGERGPRAAPGTTIEEQFKGAGARLPRGTDALVNRLHENFVRKPAEEAIGGFSHPSKMPCPAWSIDAGLCKTGSKLGQVPGSVCENCFAKGGRYVMPNVQEAMARRLAAYNRDPENFGRNVAAALPRDQKEFRWFDSGDVQSPQMFGQIVEAARLRPDVKFWLPTKEAQMVMKWQRENGPVPDNLAVRQSLPMKDVLPTDLGPREKRALPLAGVTTDRAKATCAATLGDKTCESAGCRDCWNKAKDVVYLEH